MNYAVGSLVRTRGREWIVLPESQDDMLMLRPMGGTDDEVTGVCTDLETVESAHFQLPDPAKAGDYHSCRLLRDAVRLGFRSSAGPFRSFARLGFEPRPYQLVPLLLALRLNPVRLLIADDVGIGKTIEAGLAVRELIDRGEVQRFAVLCPPHLAEQWQRELSEKFHLDAELVLSSTASQLERRCAAGQSIFDAFPHTIVSMDFIKSDRRRDEFLRTCPELVIVDEAHTCADAGAGMGGRHQRYQLVRSLAKASHRHVILVTATPHSGNEGAFRSLLTILDESFSALPEELSGRENEHHRRRLAQHLIQRRRGDILRYLNADTPFPSREEKEDSYKLTPDYKKFFARVLNYARETVVAKPGERREQRVRWWSALALLRALASSPAAAAATLRNRAATAEAETPEEADKIGQRTVLDLVDDEAAEGIDVTPGAVTDTEDDSSTGQRRRLLDMAREADRLRGDLDGKLLRAVPLIKGLLNDGFAPIVFCRFIDTAEYVAEELRRQLPKGIEVDAVTGRLPPAEREERVQKLAAAPRRILICTDCLSEGINLQEQFTAVFHYDLSWNPTRHEQREGRVDRYGQRSKQVRVLTYYGIDNQIDGIVLDILIRKHKSIRTSLGISVPVPVDTEKVIEAIFEGLLLRSRPNSDADQLSLFNADDLEPIRRKVHGQWESTAEREKRSRTMFAQEMIKVEEIARELNEVRAAIGNGVDVKTFTCDALRLHGAVVGNAAGDATKLDMRELPRGLRDVLGVQSNDEALTVVFDPPVPNDTALLTRTHPLVEKLSAYTMDTALDPALSAKASRCGAIRTHHVQKRTTVLLLRLRYEIISTTGDIERPLLAEDCQAIAFTGAPEAAQWLPPDIVAALLQLQPDANISAQQAANFIAKVVEGFAHLQPELERFAVARGQAILQSHLRVRDAARLRSRAHVEAKLPPDVLGIYVYLPMTKI